MLPSLDGRVPASSLLPPLSDLDDPAFERPSGLLGEDDSVGLWIAEPPVKPRKFRNLVNNTLDKDCLIFGLVGQRKPDIVCR